jgi:hypothetical protein
MENPAHFCVEINIIENYRYDRNVAVYDAAV